MCDWSPHTCLSCQSPLWGLTLSMELHRASQKTLGIVYSKLQVSTDLETGPLGSSHGYLLSLSWSLDSKTLENVSLKML
jgi:hypothetical protein